MKNGNYEYKLLYSGQLSPIARLNDEDRVVEEYVYGSRVNVPDYILKDGTKYRIVKDHLGSIRMIVNTSTGEVVKTLRYSEFGEITEETGTFETIFGFAGGIRDADSGLTKFGARWYDPETGRWLEKEPLGFNGSDNFYSYCDGDPVNWIDVTGYQRMKCRSEDEAIKDAALEIIDNPLHLFFEFSSTIYFYNDDNGDVCYDHTPIRTDYDSTNVLIRILNNMSSMVHNHPDGSPISWDDKVSSDFYKIDTYLINDSGDIDAYFTGLGDESMASYLNLQ